MDNHMKKIVIIGSGLAGSVSAMIAEAGLSDELEIVEISEESVEKKIRSRIGEGGENVKFTINEVPKLKYHGSREKPTCGKHHEYVKHTDQEGNLIKSIWVCRFCNRNINQSVENIVKTLTPE